MQVKKLISQETPVVDVSETQSLPENSGKDALSSWRSRLEYWWNALLAVFPLFIVTRIVFLLLTYFGVMLFSVPKYSMKVLPLSMFIYSWDRWDAARFTTHRYQRLSQPGVCGVFPALPVAYTCSQCTTEPERAHHRYADLQSGLAWDAACVVSPD